MKEMYYEDLSKRERQKLAREFLMDKIGFIPNVWDDRWDELDNYKEGWTINVSDMDPEEKRDFSERLDKLVSRIERLLK